MARMPHIRRKKPSTHDANRRLADPWTDLVIQEINSLPSSVKVDYLKEQFLSKYVSTETDPPELRRSRAIDKWLNVELVNEVTNDRLYSYDDGYHILPHLKWSKFLHTAQSMVVDIIGETVPIDALIGSFSGGASTSRSRTESHPASKYIGRADITSAALPWWDLVSSELEGWDTSSYDIRIVSGNVLFTVPKNTTIDRVAAKEPDLNMFMQKGVGNYFRSSLRRVGINLNDQSRNQRLARLGSLDGSLATIDLSSASDSVTTALVELLLPSQWHSLLNALRSPVTIIDGIEHVNAMFSSMGNGFTFELESLLFYVITRTVCYCRGYKGTVSVYGDDIIAPSGSYHDLEWVLKCCGFAVNPDKSFHKGPFRESCGGHYHEGIDITPFYIRKPITHLIDLIHIANAIRKWSSVEGLRILRDDLEPLWSLIVESIPKCLWGGFDLGNPSQLVSPGKPGKRLVAMQRCRSTGLGGYFHWLNSTDGRESPPLDAVMTSERTDMIQKYRIRPCRKTSDWHPISEFISEL